MPGASYDFFIDDGENYLWGHRVTKQAKIELLLKTMQAKILGESEWFK